jgi:hypothetical protein
VFEFRISYSLVICFLRYADGSDSFVPGALDGAAGMYEDIEVLKADGSVEFRRRRTPMNSDVGSEVGIGEFRKNLIGILREIHENFVETLIYFTRNFSIVSLRNFS